MRAGGSGDRRIYQRNRELQPCGHRILRDIGTTRGVLQNCMPSIQAEPIVPRVAIQIRDSNIGTTTSLVLPLPVDQSMKSSLRSESIDAEMPARAEEGPLFAIAERRARDMPRCFSLPCDPRT